MNVSHYRILSHLGTGGMGQVWLAEDKNLDRRVALKVLSPQLASDPDRMKRFVNEAKVIAALNHPNIAQIYEFVDAGGLPMLAMEYVDGITVKDRIASRPMDPDDVLDVAMQVSDALDEAHSKNIIHRDVKPGNIMLTGRGTVKVLDFGLAKIDTRRSNLDDSTASGALTSPGEVMGTLRYMSPEQCLGKEVDARTDIFSLGSVLYEMATGVQPFNGVTSAAVYDAILNRTPPPPSSVNRHVPVELDRIIRRAMEKDRDLRYQTASDLRADLKRARRDSGSQPAAALSPIARQKWLWPALALLVIVGVVSAIAWRNQSAPPPPMKILPVTTTPGSESQPSFSPDGNQVAYSWSGEAGENWDIYVKVVDAGTPLRLTTNPALDISPAWSPDGRYIAFLRQSDRESDSAFLMIPALGGLERKLSNASPHRTGLNTPYIAWSPDGRKLALADRNSGDEPMAIFLFDMETGQRKRLTEPAPKTYGDSGPVFSPDGSSVLFVRSGSMTVQDLFIVPSAGGDPRRVTTEGKRIFGATWSPRDDTIILSSTRVPNSRLWRLSPKGGPMQRIEGGSDNPSFISISRQGSRLAYTRSIVDTNIWEYPLPPRPGVPTVPRRLISSTRLELAPQISPDNRRIVFASNRSGYVELWICDRQGANAAQLTSFNGPPTGSPRWSPDGTMIAFDSRPDGNPDIYLVSSQGGTPSRLTSEPSDETVPNWSRDGKQVYFSSNRTGVSQIWKMPVAGGDAVQVTRGGGFFGIESVDGKWLYYSKSPNEPGLWRMPLSGGKEEPLLPEFRAGFWSYWVVVSQGLYYLDRQEVEGVGVKYYLRSLEFRSSRDREVLMFDRRPFNAGLAISPDGGSVLYNQVDQSDSDIMMVENFR